MRKRTLTRLREPLKPALLVLALLLASSPSPACSATGADRLPQVEEAPAPDAEEQEDGGPPDSDDTEPSLEERLDALLAEGAEAEVYGEKENCLYRRKFSHIDVVSEDILIFSRGKNYWINQLKRSCLGLRRSMVIHTVTHGVNSLCSNDLVYANRPVDLNQGFTSNGRPLVVRAQCVLGEFQSIPEPYAEALKGLKE
jgi:hypothetical protein